jgi:hypothetical protein
MDSTTAAEVVPAPAPMQASVGVMDSLTSELAIVRDLTGGNPIVAIILVSILVLGGKAGWAFWTKRQELKADLEEKRMELAAKIKLAKIKAEDNDNDDEKEQRKRKAKKG